MAHKIELQKQLLDTLQNCPGASCPDAKLAAPSTHACASLCVKSWAKCMGPCTVNERYCELRCTRDKDACESRCTPSDLP